MSGAEGGKCVSTAFGKGLGLESWGSEKGNLGWSLPQSWVWCENSWAVDRHSGDIARTGQMYWLGPKGSWQSCLGAQLLQWGCCTSLADGSILYKQVRSLLGKELKGWEWCQWEIPSCWEMPALLNSSILLQGRQPLAAEAFAHLMVCSFPLRKCSWHFLSAENP